jgi:hypothetical protein
LQVLILPHIAFEGLETDHANVKGNFERFDTVTDQTLYDLLSAPIVDMDKVATVLDGTKHGTLGTEMQKAFKQTNPAVTVAANKKYEFDPGQDWYCRQIYRGYSTTDAGGEDTLTTNTGHLGEVDSLEFCNRVWGTAGGQIYKPRVQLTKSVKSV